MTQVRGGTVKRILVIGAHPDDCEIHAGGAAVLWRARGDQVRFLSVTNGDAGHHRLDRSALAARRLRESRAAGRLLDVEYDVLDHRDGELLPTLENRHEVIRIIRRFQPDVILTHRPWDYHPDHRYTAALVLDAMYMITVPLVAPEVPHLQRQPVLAYLWDEFRRPYAFDPSIVVDVDSVMDRKWAALDCHESQFYEWLPYNFGELGQVPDDRPARRQWLETRWTPHLEAVADGARAALVEAYGHPRGDMIRFAEAFEIAEHGRWPTPEEIPVLFPV